MRRVPSRRPLASRCHPGSQISNLKSQIPRPPPRIPFLKSQVLNPRTPRASAPPSPPPTRDSRTSIERRITPELTMRQPTHETAPRFLVQCRVPPRRPVASRCSESFKANMTPIHFNNDTTPLRCHRCLTDLTGRSDADNCPTCGLPIDETLAADKWVSLLDEHRVVCEDTPCLNRGYNLRGLHESARCPECAAAASKSLRGDFLCYSNPHWIRTVARGAALTSAGCWGIALAMVGIFLVWRSAYSIAPAMAAIELVSIVVVWGVILLLTVGAWLLTTPGATYRAPEGRFAARRLTRAALCLSLVLILIRLLFPRWTSTWAPWILVVFSVLYASAMLIAIPTLFHYCKALCARIPDQTLEKRAALLRDLSTLGLAALAAATVAQHVIFSLQNLTGFWSPGHARDHRTGDPDDRDDRRALLHHSDLRLRGLPVTSRETAPRASQTRRPTLEHRPSPPRRLQHVVVRQNPPPVNKHRATNKLPHNPPAARPHGSYDFS